MSEGYTSNGTTHLQENHKDDMEILEQNKKRTLATLLTNPSNGFSNRSAKKAKVSSTSINSSAKNSAKNPAIDKLHQLIFKSVNNRGYHDIVINDPNFRSVIQHCIDYGNLIRRGFSHIGNCKFVTLQCSSFKGLIKKIRQW